MSCSHIPILFLTLLLFSCTTENKVDINQEIQAIEQGLLPPIQVKGDSVKTYQIQMRMDHYKVPGVSVAIVENGKVKWAKGYGTATPENPVDTTTLFQAGSISKPVAALAALQLVEAGKIDLDEDVNNYLSSWKVPENEFTTQEKVTLRRLLSHTAGTNVHGFPGYQRNDTFPSINAVLDGKGNTPAVRVDTIPGSSWRYSGGGYTIMEKLVEDVGGMPLEAYMADHVLPVVGMANSTYQQPLNEELHQQASAAFDTKGQVIEGKWHDYPEQAAAGLWTTPLDLARYCMEIQEIAAGKKDGILSPAMVEEMLTKEKNDWGLGPALQWEGDSLLFRHGGKNAGFTNTFIAFAHQGQAAIIMTNADKGGKLMGEIMRSISAYYGWGIAEPEEVEIIAIPDSELAGFAGTYRLDWDLPEGEEYLVDISVENGKLFVFDPNNEEKNYLTPQAKLNFIDLETGDKVEFSTENESISLLWNKRYTFVKVD